MEFIRRTFWQKTFPALLVLLVGAARPAFAWGNFGHETISLIAWQQLTPAEQASLDKIIAGAPDIFPAEAEPSALFFVATWPDVIRERYRTTHKAEPLAIFTSLGIKDSSRADGLHFADYDATQTIVAPKGVSVIAGVNLSAKALADPASTVRQKAEALAYLIHCVGDAHQPLHSGHAADKGGNDIEIAGLGASHAKTELHAVWDTGLFNSTKIKDPATYIKNRLSTLIAAEKSDAAKSLDPAAWVVESHKLAESSAYVDENGHTIPSGAVLSGAYVEANLKVVDLRLVMAGLRLAAVIKKAID